MGNYCSKASKKDETKKRFLKRMQDLTSQSKDDIYNKFETFNSKNFAAKFKENSIGMLNELIQRRTIEKRSVIVYKEIFEIFDDNQFTSNLMQFIFILIGTIKIQKVGGDDKTNISGQLSQTIKSCYNSDDWILNIVIQIFDFEIAHEFGHKMQYLIKKHSTNSGNVDLQVLRPMKPDFFTGIYKDIIIQNLFPNQNNDEIKYLYINPDIEFRTDLDEESKKEIKSLLKCLQHRIEILNGIMFIIWKEYLNGIKIFEINKDHLEILLKKSNADRLFLKHSMVRSMSFYLYKMLHQKEVNTIIEVSKESENNEISDLECFDVYDNLLYARMIEKLTAGSITKLKKISYIPSCGIGEEKNVNICDIVEVFDNLNQVQKKIYKNQVGKEREIGDLYPFFAYVLVKAQNYHVSIFFQQ